MSRTRAEALALVNWRGVFYERYLFDRHVTALEGSNGAGKTTVMIAAYVVLLPDMSRLRFTNLGETDATGGDKGIWGRLGEPGRPSYAALDFILPTGDRLLAGVHLVRKGEPSVEPTPFIVSGLTADVRLQDLLLMAQGDSEAVPELSELKENAARLGGRLQAYPSAREYFAALFEYGVTPLRLGTDEERRKLNDMLRTSMTGGISRALTTELRGFLLKEQTGLADTLAQMRANLDACRRTRTEVREARQLESEIGGVFDAGQVMFAAAFLATRERATDLQKRLQDAIAACTLLATARDEAREALSQTLADLATLDARRAVLGAALAEARVRQALMHRALEAADEVARCELDRATAEEQAQLVAERRAVAEFARTAARAGHRRAQEEYALAASGLADLQAGLETLHRRANGYTQATRRLAEAQRCLSPADLAPPSLLQQAHAAQTELAAVDEERRAAVTRLADADAHRAEHAATMAALRQLIGSEIEAARAYDVALDALTQHRHRVGLAEQLPGLERELADARMRATKQSEIRARAAELKVPSTEEPAVTRIERLHGEAEASLRAHEEQGRLAMAAAIDAERRVKELEVKVRDLAAREPAWRQCCDAAGRLAAYLGVAVVDRAGLDVGRTLLRDQLAEARQLEASASFEREQLLRQARDLLAGGGPFAPALMSLRDQLDAELVASAFEDVEIDEAARLEARLGGLAYALVVDDPATAAAAIAGRADTLGDVLLVPRDADLAALAAGRDAAPVGERDVAVAEGLALRVSRLPSNPRLGRRAREARAVQLRSEAALAERTCDEARRRRRQLEALTTDGEALLAGLGVWLAGDPTPIIEATQSEIGAATAARLHAQATGREHGDAARALRPRVDALRGLLGVAPLLDPPDYDERVCALEASRDAARTARHLVENHQRDAAHVERHQAVLRQAPLSDEDRHRLAERVSALKARREALDTGLEALAYVQDNIAALAWTDAPRRLAEHQALVPSLRAQLAEADAQQQQTQAAAVEADRVYDRATADFHTADGARRVAEQALAAAERRFVELGVSDPSTEALVAARDEVARLDAEHSSQDERRDDLIRMRGSQENALHDLDARVGAAEDKVSSERREAEPAVRRWEDLRTQSGRHGLVGSLLTAAPAELVDVRGHVNLVQQAKTKEQVLRERLERAQGGPAFLAGLEMLGDTSDAAFADAYLGLWLGVRDWLRRRLPAHFAEVDDPREALARLRDQLASLEQRLADQESVLRGSSEDVARGIDTEVRRARGQVNRLNQSLGGVSFGGIQDIRVRPSQVEHMEQVLRALREGAAQTLLFQGDLPIEDALEEIFRRHGGGRTGGQRLLDYREYLHLQVEIRRKAGGDWEPANPTRLSTGEAIGVGAALMMVVLTAWERDATLLRGKKAHGSLRFLFLDEANRLSHDNLGVLFDLCQTLDLQLLIAAPEVARAEGNTTYRLVRTTTPDGREEVVVSGRRTRGDG